MAVVVTEPAAYAPILIVNADDFGLSEGVNRAILKCHEAGNVTSTTMMVSMPGSEDAARLAKSASRLGIGLHFSLTEGVPLTPCTSLLGPEGRFLPRSRLVRKLIARAVSGPEIRREFEAQLLRLEALGVSPTHVDSHEHVHMSPPVFSAIAPVIERSGLPVRMVSPPWEFATLVSRPLKFAKQLVMRLNAAWFRRAGKVRSSDRLVSVHDLVDPSGFFVTDYSDLLARGRGCGVLELMVHPYWPGDDLRDFYGAEYGVRRPFIAKCQREFELLSRTPVFSEAGFRLEHYGAL